MTARILFGILYFAISSLSFGQTRIDSLFYSLYEQENFDEIIAKGESYNEDSLSAFSHYIIGVAYQLKGNENEALIEFYKSKNRDAKITEFYPRLLYKIGYIEKEMGRHLQSNEAFTELFKQDSTDYLVATFIIQNFFAMDSIEAAMPYRKILYDANNDNSLPFELQSEYCYDRFRVDDKNIFACEVYPKLDSPEAARNFSKQILYVYSGNDSLIFTLETVKIHQLTPSDMKYVLNQRFWEQGKLKTSQSYWSFTFTDPVDYRELKKAAISVLIGEVSPTTESRFK